MGLRPEAGLLAPGSASQRLPGPPWAVPVAALHLARAAGVTRSQWRVRAGFPPASLRHRPITPVSLPGVQIRAVEPVRDVLRHLGPRDLVEARRIEDEQERRAAATVEHDRQAHAAVLLVAAGLADEDGLAGIAPVLVPGGDRAVSDVARPALGD